ncbi:MAG TPA: Mur ligase domain-containing protein [Thermodesulfovibrionales bacterium]|nr:Mur ligase domain-containing protein [Thermodesulfovibrionales bacterium]
MLKIFFSGIGGSGVSAIAGFMAARGHSVSGSDRIFDRNPDHPLLKVLKAGGISIVPQNGSGIDASLDLAVFSTAVEDGLPEGVRARDLGIPVKTRPDYLSEIVSAFRSVAVAGTSGKSTTAGMLAFLMQKLDMAPNYIGGGRVKQFRSDRNIGNWLAGQSDHLIMEACESDGTLINYKPQYSIISNLSLDHNPVEQTAGMFETLARNTKETVIVNNDDRNLDLCKFEDPILFSILTTSDFQARDINYHPFHTTFRVQGIHFRLSLPGQYNLYNAVSCITLLCAIGVPLRDIARVLPEFSGIERRFDVHLNNAKHLVIDDYAHNPHKIEALMTSTERIRGRICYIFQPHGYGPTRLMKKGYIETFTKHLRPADHLVLLPIYYAGGTARQDISSEDLLRGIVAAGKSAEALHERSSLLDRLREWDNYVVFGARDETLADLAREIAKRLD